MKKALKIELHDINVYLSTIDDIGLSWNSDNGEYGSYPNTYIDGNTVKQFFEATKQKKFVHCIKTYREYACRDYGDKTLDIQAKILDTNLIDIEFTTKFHIDAGDKDETWEICITRLTYSGTFTIWWDVNWFTEKEYKEQ